MKEKKIKRINIRVSKSDYLYLKRYYLWSKELKKDHTKSFSEYIRYLLIIGIENI